MKLIIILTAATVVIYLLFRKRQPSTTLRHNPQAQGDAAPLPPEDKDDWEDVHYRTVVPRKVDGITVNFDYVDRDGATTNRTVTITSVENDLYGGLLIGHCHLRGGKRTFRFERTSSVANAADNAPIPDLLDYLNELYEASPEHTVDEMHNEHGDLLDVIYFMAKADGQMRKEEVEVIARYLGTLINDDRLDGAMVRDALDYTQPSLHAFRISLGRVLRSGSYDLNALLQCCEDIVNTQKTVHPNEKAALDEIARKIRKTINQQHSNTL